MIHSSKNTLLEEFFLPLTAAEIVFVKEHTCSTAATGPAPESGRTIAQSIKSMRIRNHANNTMKQNLSINDKAVNTHTRMLLCPCL